MLDSWMLDVRAESARMNVLVCAAQRTFAPAAELACQGALCARKARVGARGPRSSWTSDLV